MKNEERYAIIDREENKVLSEANKVQYLSGGYHTYKELYDYRMVYSTIAFNALY